ncbi:PREDICTED: uncharacterized protein LOC107168478, partial [Diuraphis noxia]|uniref:uncharacterized protein LOC107168478 n=1 Tax=Diuraphis noxia TaxID=143948 RepID=UPI00076395B2
MPYKCCADGCSSKDGVVGSTTKLFRFPIDEIAEQYNKPDNKLDFNSFAIENILYYISGYIVKKLIPTLKCDGCIEAITDSYIENDHVYQNNTTPKYFTIMKNRGGLKYASDGVYKIVKLTETLFKTIMVD